MRRMRSEKRSPRTSLEVKKEKTRSRIRTPKRSNALSKLPYVSGVESSVLMSAAPPGRPRTYIFVLLGSGKLVRRGHFYADGKPDHRLEVEYQDFSALPP